MENSAHIQMEIFRDHILGRKQDAQLDQTRYRFGWNATRSNLDRPNCRPILRAQSSRAGGGDRRNVSDIRFSYSSAVGSPIHPIEQLRHEDANNTANGACYRPSVARACGRHHHSFPHNALSLIHI